MSDCTGRSAGRQGTASRLLMTKRATPLVVGGDRINSVKRLTVGQEFR
ncbi:MAG: hypothetical protein QOE51_3047 [Actinoplanes sp.]|jgi:hypothetical protein|nr:hypothetical protein [Actinoplanes sp.]